jgi:uracil-DNA glycosylase family 4
MAERSSESVRRAVQQQLESLQAAGVRQLPKARAVKRAPRDVTADAAAAEPPAAARRTVSAAPATPITKLAAAESSAGGLYEADDAAGVVRSQAPTLAVLQQEVAGCTLCGELATTRTQTVFGVGNPKARLCFLGEAPGADEDKQGEPFVGRAGQLLNKILEACHLQREDVYILNILKCRPPGNRNPAPDEARNCRRFLERQLELIAPEFICCLGAVAAQNLLATETPIGKLRGQVIDFKIPGGSTKVVCTYHPAYLLRNPSAKKYTWDDMKLLMREMGTPLD